MQFNFIPRARKADWSNAILKIEIPFMNLPDMIFSSKGGGIRLINRNPQINFEL